MKVIRAFRNLDRHGQQRAPEVIEEEVRQLEPHLVRFRENLVRLEVVASQTRGKLRSSLLELFVIEARLLTYFDRIRFATSAPSLFFVDEFASRRVST